MAESTASDVLNIPELLDLVFRELGFCELASCARVCRRWWIPALRYLWEERRYPRELLSILGVLHADHPIRFKDGPCLDRWPRFRQYATLVRDIRWTIGSPDSVNGYPSHEIVTPQALKEVFMLANAAGENILPRATFVGLTPLDDESAIASTMLLTSTVRSATLCLDVERCTEESLLPMLECVKRRCPLLEWLYISSTAFDNIPAIVETIQSLQRLEYIHIPSAFLSDLRVWDVLGSLPKLHFIWTNDEHAARERRYTPDEEQRTLSFGDRFVSLKGLIHCTPLPSAISMFSGSSPDTLSKIHLWVHNPYDAPCTLVDLASAISRTVPQLESLQITSYVDDMRASPTDIAPFYSAQCLRRLSICTDYAALLTDNDYATLAASLPQLEKLEISPAPEDPTPPPTTLLALSHIAHHCRQIEKLGIFVDTAIDSLPDTSISLSVFTHTLTRINFGLSEVHSRSQVAYPLSRMFSETVPEICGGEGQNVDLYWYSDEEMRMRLDQASKDWADVHVIVEALVPFVDAVRRDAPRQRVGLGV